MIYLSRLVIVPFVISMCAAAQTAPSGYATFCPHPLNNPFPRLVMFEQFPTTFPQDRIDWKKVIPPPEFRSHFRSHDLWPVDATGASLHRQVGPSLEGCELIHINAKGQIH